MGAVAHVYVWGGPDGRPGNRGSVQGIAAPIYVWWPRRQVGHRGGSQGAAAPVCGGIDGRTGGADVVASSLLINVSDIGIILVTMLRRVDDMFVLG